MKKNLLLTPGPTQVPPQLCEALGRPIIHHRTPQFQEFLKQAQEGLRYVFQTKNEVCILACSGTGAMEASVVSFFSPGDKVVVVDGGKFGERWTELCQAYGLVVQVLKVEWGKGVDPAQVKKLLAADKEIKGVFATLCETCTAVTNDIEGLGKVVKDTPAILVVDAVSGLGVVDLKTDLWSVDVVVSGSHKGLMLPPALGFVSISEKAAVLMDKAKCPKFYFDLRKYKKLIAKTDTPFTPAIGVVIALVESLKMIKDAGLENKFKHYERLSQGVRFAVQALGLKILADPAATSFALTAVFAPEGIDADKLIKTLRDVHGITLAPGQGHLKGKIFRIAHMGCLDEYDLITGIAGIEKVLHEMGYAFILGSGVAAAQKFFNSK